MPTVNFSADDLEEAAYWLYCALIDRRRFLSRLDGLSDSEEMCARVSAEIARIESAYRKVQAAGLALGRAA